MTPLRVVRRRRTGLLAALAAVLFLLGLLGWEPRDDAWLLSVGGRPLDVRGVASVVWTNVWRDCAGVQRLDRAGRGHSGTASSAEEELAAHPAVEALRAFSPPDSHSARVLRLDAWSETALSSQDPKRSAPTWWVLQAAFDSLEPVVVLVRQAPGGAEVVPEGVWSGTTRPWEPAWRIRRFLEQRVPKAPTELLACLDPVPVFAQPPRPI